MGSVKRFGYTVLLAVLAMTEALCFLWVVTLSGSIHEGLVREQGAAPLGQYFARLAAEGDFWRALIFFLLNSFVLAAVALLLRRERLRRRADIERQKLCEDETEWEQQL